MRVVDTDILIDHFHNVNAATEFVARALLEDGTAHYSFRLFLSRKFSPGYAKENKSEQKNCLRFLQSLKRMKKLRVRQRNI